MITLVFLYLMVVLGRWFYLGAVAPPTPMTSDDELKLAVEAAKWPWRVWQWAWRRVRRGC